MRHLPSQDPRRFEKSSIVHIKVLLHRHNHIDLEIGTVNIN